MDVETNVGFRIVVAADSAGVDYKEILKKDLEADPRVDEVVDQIGLLTAADAEVHGAAGVEPVDGRDGQEPVVDVVGETEGDEALP